MANESTLSQTVENVVRAVTDFGVVPGSSQFLNGRFGSGLAHAAVGIGARVLLHGPAGLALWGLAAANSYYRSNTGHNMWSGTSLPGKSEPKPALGAPRSEEAAADN